MRSRGGGGGGGLESNCTARFCDTLYVLPLLQGTRRLTQTARLVADVSSCSSASASGVCGNRLSARLSSGDQDFGRLTSSVTSSTGSTVPSTVSITTSVVLMGELGALDPLGASAALPATGIGVETEAVSIRGGCFRFVSDFERHK